MVAVRLIKVVRPEVDRATGSRGHSDLGLATRESSNIYV